MKIKRQDQKENYKITAPWLYEFAHDLEKEGSRLDYLKQYFESREKKKNFQNIDEKMADIKDRVGFDLAHKISEELSKDNNKISSSHNSNNNTTKIAQYKHPEEDIAIMQNALKYALDMIKDNPHTNAITVLDELRNVEGLRINEINLDVKKFLDYLTSEIKKINNDTSDPVEYVSSEPLGVGEADDYKADYYHHAEPSSSI